MKGERDQKCSQSPTEGVRDTQGFSGVLLLAVVRQIQGKPETQTARGGAQVPTSLSSLPFRMEFGWLEMRLQIHSELPSGPREEQKQCSSSNENLGLRLSTESYASPSGLGPAPQSIHLCPPPPSHGPN